MTQKKKTYSEVENEKSRGKKRYLERLQEEKDAEEEIDTYVLPPVQQELFPENDE